MKLCMQTLAELTSGLDIEFDASVLY